MADEQNIEFTITTKGVDQTIYDFSRVQQAASGIAQTAANAAEEGSAGFRTLGFASAKLAEEFGVPYRAAHLLGTKIEEVAKNSFPSWGMALGGVTAGIAVSLGAMKLLIDHQKKIQEEERKAAEVKQKLREEQERAAKASADWLGKADSVIAKTKELRDAEYDRYYIQFNANRELLSNSVLQNEQRLTDLRREQVALAVKLQSLSGSGVPGAGNETAKQLQAKTNEIAALVADNNILRERLKAASLLNKGQFEQAYMGAKPAGAAAAQASEVTVVNQYQREADYQQRIADLYKATSDSKLTIWAQELRAFDAKTAAMMANAESEQEYYDTLANREIERATKVANHETEVKRQQMEAQRSMAMEQAQVENMLWSQGTQLIGDMAALSAQHGKSGAEAQKKAARMQAVVNTASGIARAFADYSWPYSGLVAAMVGAAGAIQISKINSSSYESSTGGLTMGGLPAVSAPAPAPAAPSVYISINGSGYQKQDIAEQVLQTLYDNNGSLGGFAVSVSRSA